MHAKFNTDPSKPKMATCIFIRYGRYKTKNNTGAILHCKTAHTGVVYIAVIVANSLPILNDSE